MVLNKSLDCARTHKLRMSVFAIAADVKKNAVGVSANIFIEIFKNGQVAEHEHLATTAVSFLFFREISGIFCFRKGHGEKREEKKGPEGREMLNDPYSTSCT